MTEPNEGRVVKEDGTSKSIKMSIGKKKLHSVATADDRAFARMFYESFVINGVQYCRRHLMLFCHLCEVDNSSLQEQVDDERERLGLRPGGDPRLNAKAVRWKDFIQGKQLQNRLQVDLLVMRYGRNHHRTHPEHWQEFTRKSTIEEREINDRFLPEVQETFDQGCSQCCYWACQTLTPEKLLKCAGCGIVKYCCKEHQQKDWAWEHKGECTCQLPDFFKEEMEQDRQRNLRGDYSEYKGPGNN